MIPRAPFRAVLSVAAVLLLSGALAGPALAKRDVDDLLAISALEDRRSLGDGELAKFLEDENAETRAAAARAFGRIGYDDGVAPLLKRLNDTDAAVRFEVIFALGQIGKEDARDALVRIAGSNGAAGERAAAVQALGKLGGDGAAEAILPFLADPDPAVRAGAAWALARTGDEVAGLDLAPLLEDPDASVREMAVWAGGRLAVHDLGAATIRLLEDESPEVRLAATKAIGQIGSKDAVPKLQLMVRDPDWRVRVNVATALGQSEDLTALPGLTLLAPDDNVHVRAAVAAALATVPYHYKKDDILFPFAMDPEPEVRGAAGVSFAVGQESRKSAIPEHFQMMGDSTSTYVVGKMFESFADASRRMERGLPLYQWRGAACFYMRGRLDREDIPLAEQIAAAYQLGAFDTANPWPRTTLVKALDKRHWAVKAAVIHALCEMTPSEQADAAVHKAETPGLLRKVLDEDPDAREHVDLRLELAQGIGSFEGADAQAIARELLNDEDVRVREAAAESLEKMGEEKPEVRPAGPLPGQAAPLDDAYLKSRPGKFTAVVKTNRGEFEIELLNQEAPRTVQNFVDLAEKRFFDGLSFHRVVPNFVIQTGCPIGNGWGDPGYAIRSETNPLPYERGMVGMANAGKDTGGSQWFVTHSPQRHLDGRYTLFGKVTEGMEVVDAIRVEDTIESIEIKRKLF